MTIPIRPRPRRTGKSSTRPTIPPLDGTTEEVGVVVGATNPVDFAPVPVAAGVLDGVALAVLFGVETRKKFPATGLPSLASVINLLKSKPMRLTTFAVRFAKMVVKSAGTANP